MTRTRRAPAEPLPPRGRHKLAPTVAAVSGLRVIAYRIFAALLLPPTAQRLRWLREVAGELRHCDDELAVFAFFGPWQRFLGVLRETDELEANRLQEEHIRLFSLNPTSEPCYPYESWYVAPGGEEMGWVTAQLQLTYEGAGLQLATPLNENPDHAAVELEFMAYLCQRETAAWECFTPDEGLRLLMQERLFLRLHLGQWFGVFTGLVRQATTEQLYVVGVEAADAFVQHDLDLVESLAGEIKRLRSEAGAASVSASGPTEKRQ